MTQPLKLSSCNHRLKKNPHGFEIHSCLNTLSNAGVNMERYYFDCYMDVFGLKFEDTLTLLEANLEKLQGVQLELAPLFNAEAPEITDDTDAGDIRYFNKQIEWYRKYFGAFADKRVTHESLT